MSSNPSFNATSALQRKRRIVPIDRRKRALFSCDRCKIRKIKCRRIQNNDLKYDNITPCIQCAKAGVACTTSIPRKKRFYGPVENINLHYKCLLSLVSGLFPDKDVYNIEELIELGRSLKIDMPSIDATDDSLTFGPNGEHRIKLEHVGKEGGDAKVESTKPVETSDKSEEPEKSKKSKKLEKSTEPAVPSLPPSIKIRSTNNCDKERLIMDRFGHTHFIGNFGTASLLNGLCDLIIKRSYSVHPPTSTQDIRDSSVQTITSENEPVYQYPTHLYNLDTINVDRFPLINLIKKEEADIYVEVFFEKVHPYYFIFNRHRFNERYQTFWDELKRSDKSERERDEPLHMSSAEICCIYMVWILGRRFQQYSNPSDTPKGAVLNEEMMTRFIDIIRLTISDVVLTPTIDGIRLLFLFSTYLSSIKVRESGYCLMEMAAIQAKGLGLHRKVIVDKFKDGKSDEMKRIMWSLAKSESLLCCSLGRASAIPWEETDIDLPKIDDVTDELFKTYYMQSVKLTRIIFHILDYKKKTQKEPLSLASMEKALMFQKELQNFWVQLPDQWKDYKSLPIRRYKPKLHIQYHYYFITLTLPMFLHIVTVQNYVIKKGDPLLTLLVHGIQSSFSTAELVTYTDANGFFNGTIYYDVFYCYNAIMVLTLTFILFSSSKQSGKKRSVIDLDYLDSEYQINMEHLLREINMIRKLILNNLNKIDGTMRRISDIIETLLEDLGIIRILVRDYGAPESTAKKIEGKNESGQTSVSASLPGSFRRLKLHLSSHHHKKRKVAKPQPPAPNPNIPYGMMSSGYLDGFKQGPRVPYNTFQNAQTLSVRPLPNPDKFVTQNIAPAYSRHLKNNVMAPGGGLDIPLQYQSDSGFSVQQVEPSQSNEPMDPPQQPTVQVSPAPMTSEQPQPQPQLGPYGLDSTSSAISRQSSSDVSQIGTSTVTPNGSNINDILTNMALSTDLMDALFGSELLRSTSPESSATEHPDHP